MSRMQHDNTRGEGSNGSTQMGTGIAVGLPVGVALALILDSWAIGLGVGLVLGITVGAILYRAAKRGSGPEASSSDS